MAFRRDHCSRPCSHARRPALLPGLACLLFVLLHALPARAQRELLTTPGQKGQIVIDQLSGFRGGVSGVVGAGGDALYPSINYYGPIGVAVEHYSQAAPPPDAPNSFVVTTTTFWLAPSLDVFVINHLSIGGMVQIAYTSASESLPMNGTQSTSTSLPSNTSFAIMPRVGYMIWFRDSGPFGRRWALWPRLALGYASNAVGSIQAGGGNVPAVGSSVYGFVMELDVGLLFRVTENFFLRLAPDFAWMPGAGNSVALANNPKSIDESASYWDFSMTFGLGVMFDL
jgi:hypothetical protein